MTPRWSFLRSGEGAPRNPEAASPAERERRGADGIPPVGIQRNKAVRRTKRPVEELPRNLGAMMTEGESRLPRRCSQAGPSVGTGFPKPPFAPFLPSARREARLPAAKRATLTTPGSGKTGSPPQGDRRERRAEGGRGQRTGSPTNPDSFRIFRTKLLRKGVGQTWVLPKHAERRREGKPRCVSPIPPSSRAPGILGAWLSSPEKPKDPFARLPS